MRRRISNIKLSKPAPTHGFSTVCLMYARAHGYARRMVDGAHAVPCGSLGLTPSRVGHWGSRRPFAVRLGSRRPVWVIGAYAVPCGGVAAAARGPTRSLRSLGGRRRVRGAPPGPFGPAPRPLVVFRPPSGRSSSSPLPRLGRPFRRPLWAAPFSAAVALRRWSWGPGRAAPFPPPRGSPLFPCFSSSGCSALFGRHLVLGGGCAPLPLALR